MAKEKKAQPRVFAGAASPGAARTMIIVTAATVLGGLALYSIVPMHGPRSWISLVVGLAAVALIVPLTIRQGRAVAKSDRPVVDAIEALALLLTLLVLGFSSVYVVLGGYPNQVAEVQTKIDAVYFTLSTLATVGFGDAHAVGQAARVIVSIQIVFDLVFITVAVRLFTTVAKRRVAEQLYTDANR